MLIIVLATASMLAFAFGIHRNLRLIKELKEEEFGPIQAGSVVIVWAGLSLVPAVGAAWLAIARYAELDGVTRLIGLAPAGLLLVVILSTAIYVIRDML
jgi:hypothetical protein